MPAERGLCVATAVSKSCWDACNMAHPVESYATGGTADMIAGVALMVKQIRTGMRFGSCPGATFTPTCNPGERCTPPGLTWGRGMCLTVTGKGNQCLDMCDDQIPLTTFHDTPGKQAGTVSMVQLVRAGRDPAGLTTCPMRSIWLWLWIPLFLCFVIGLCAGVYYLFNLSKSRGKRGNKAFREQDPAYAEDEAPLMDYQQVGPEDMDMRMAPPQTMDQMDPMPVIDDYPQDNPVTMPLGGQFAAAPSLSQPTPEYNIFNPQLGSATTSAPQAVAAPMGTYYPGMAVPTVSTYAAPATLASPMTFPPQAGSMSVSGYQGSMLQSRPAYGAYGSYGPVTTPSMRIG